MSSDDLHELAKLRIDLVRIACAVGLDVFEFVSDPSLLIARSALESCNRARAAAEVECALLRAAMLDDSAALIRAHDDDDRSRVLDVATRLRARAGVVAP
jgi:hypothetical protein